MDPNRTDKIDVIILAGGKGTRLQAVVSDVPKPMAVVNGRPFLDYQLAQLARSPLVGTVVLALGHLAEKVVAHYTASPPELPLAFVIEEKPLGTAGAARNCLAAATGDRLLVMNGDSLFDLDVGAIEAVHRRLAPAGTIALLDVPDAGRFGSVTVADDYAVGFVEKTNRAEQGTINAGVYLFERSVLEAIPPDTAVSMEHNVLPQLAARHELAATVFRSDFIDIGLPETYRYAAEFIPRLFGTE